MEEEEDYAQKPLLSTTSSSSTCDLVKRTGNFWTTTVHIITAVIGAGVLSLAWSVAQLGWIAGPVTMLIFAGVTMVASWLLADCYRSPDPETGTIINHTYMQAVKLHLGGKEEWACGLLQHVMMYGTEIAYTITPAVSMRALRIRFSHRVCFMEGWKTVSTFGLIPGLRTFH